MKEIVALFIEPKIDYPNPIPNTGMHLGLLQIASAVKKALPFIVPVFWSEQINLCSSYVKGSTSEEFKAVILKDNPKYCFISALSCQINRASELCREAHELGVQTVVLGGVFASFAGKINAPLLSDFDYIVCGSSLNSCIDIINAVENNITIERIIDSDTNCTNKILPFSISPDYRFFPNKTAVDLQLPAVLEFSRGCNNNCKFCTLVEHSRGIVYNSAEHLAHQEKTLLEFGYKKAIISDDTFLLNEKICVSQLDKMRSASENGLSKIVMTRVDMINRRTAELFKKYNISEVVIGVEHINASILESMNKTHNAKEWKGKVKNALDILSDYDIVSHPIYMLGWSGEKEDTLKELVDFAVVNGQRDTVQPFVSFVTPHPGSYLWSHRKELGINLFPASLMSYTHLSPVSYPLTLGDRYTAIELLVEAHNVIRTETGVYKRNPVIDINNPYIKGSIKELLRWDGA